MEDLREKFEQAEAQKDSGGTIPITKFFEIIERPELAEQYRKYYIDNHKDEYKLLQELINKGII